jgi:DNA invertase Pin-like site-specific DNA recombinase
VGYARVSSIPQNTRLQRDALAEIDCVRVFEDKISSRAKDRPALLAALDYLRERGIGLRILTGRLAGTYTPTGEGTFFFTMMAAFAELERDMLRERTMAGLAAARAQGRLGGRPVVMDADKLAATTARRAKGESPTQIAKALGVPAPASTDTSPSCRRRYLRGPINRDPAIANGTFRSDVLKGGHVGREPCAAARCDAAARR